MTPKRQRRGRLAAAGDRRDEHDFVAVLEDVGLAAEKADVFVVDVDVDEAAELAGVVLDLGGERGERAVDLGDQAGQVGGVAGQLLLAIGVPDEGGRENDLDGNGSAPGAEIGVKGMGFLPIAMTLRWVGHPIIDG
jgi:hypothetical protein